MWISSGRGAISRTSIININTSRRFSRFLVGNKPLLLRKRIEVNTTFRPLFSSLRRFSISSPVYSLRLEEKIRNATRMTGNQSPPGVVVNWDFNHLKKDEILKITDELVKGLKKGVDEIVAAPVGYKTTLKALLELEQWFRNESELVSFPSYVAEDKDLRDASRDASKIIEEAVVEVNMRVDLFKKLCEYRDQCADKDGISAEQRRALDKYIRDGKRNGLNLDEATRNEIKKIKNDLNENALDFSKNVAEDKWEHLFTADELAGLPASFLEGLEKDEATGKYKVTLKYPHLFPITKTCKVPETRRIMETANASKAMDTNTKILEDMIELRQREAKLLGFESHAQLVQEELMAKDPTTVSNFLEDLAKKLQPLWAKEKALWLELKEKEFKENGWEFNGKLEPWDARYYMQKIEETQYAIDQEKYKEYFPVDVVTSGLLQIYQTLLHLTFKKLENVPVWHPEVEAYEVRDSRNQELMGYFYLDLYPRDGKYTHACCVPLQPSFLGSDGQRVPAVAAMLCNFPKPTPTRPALLPHNDVETFFHEFGHVMHVICSKTETMMYAGASGVEKDFVECPSQMLENWVWHTAPLSLMSKHYKTGEILPKDMIDKLVDSKKANAGAFNLRQIVLGLFDQKIHKAIGRVDTAKVYAETSRELIGMDPIPNTNFAASFGHLAHGYSARYYSYLWSEVFSEDMFETCFGEKLMDPQNGLHYREKILQPGGSFDATVLLRNFLGRDPKPEPFLKAKGLDNL